MVNKLENPSRLISVSGLGSWDELFELEFPVVWLQAAKTNMGSSSNKILFFIFISF